MLPPPPPPNLNVLPTPLLLEVLNIFFSSVFHGCHNPSGYSVSTRITLVSVVACRMTHIFLSLLLSYFYLEVDDLEIVRQMRSLSVMGFPVCSCVNCCPTMVEHTMKTKELHFCMLAVRVLVPFTNKLNSQGYFK